MAKRRDMMIAKSRAIHRLGPDKDRALKRIISVQLTLGMQEELDGRYVTGVEGIARIAGIPGMQARKMTCEADPGSSREAEMAALKITFAALCDAFLRQDEPVEDVEPKAPAEPDGDSLPKLEECPGCHAIVVAKVIARGTTAGRKRCPKCNEFMDVPPVEAPTTAVETEEAETDG